ncbi:hypothetical protein [Hubei picorna-like virus 58]|uniref:hypothetical protein n=1 Tax=Hubei picorna-like virus 58 TaxID=1923140 RepID=UPI00090C49AE|nr:hypothetical protein [Hubei picorna-like virus 58]APG77456.1 hypothetical protein [Hubei picorna-like virus 58]
MTTIRNILSGLPLFSSSNLEKTVSISLITANVISVANSLYIVIKCEKLPPSVKVVNYISLTTSIVSLASAIFSIASKFLKPERLGILTDEIEKYIEHLLRTKKQSQPDIEMKELGKANSDDSSVWSITNALTTLGSLIMAALTGTGLISASKFITGSSVLRSAGTYKKEADTLIKNIATEIFGMDVIGDRVYIDKLKELCTLAVEITATPVYKFATNPELVQQFRQLNADIIDIMDRKYDNVKNSNIAKSYLMHLNTSRVSLTEKLRLVNEMLREKQRQVTVGIMLCGPPGIGKSTLIKYLTNHCAKTLGYKKGLYNLNTGDGFYEVYGGEAFGVYDEFASTVGNDPSIKPLNSIISGDYFNFEGSDNAVKMQPCLLKCVFLSSNEDTPQLKQTLKDKSIEAFFTRVDRIICSDPVPISNRDSAPHRKPDFSHLNFNFVTNTDTDGANLKSVPINIKELINYVISKMAFNEFKFLRQITQENVDADTQKRMSFLQKLITHTDVANSKGGKYFIVRLEGAACTGKTTRAKAMMERIATAFKKNIHTITDFDTAPEEDAIYLIDDMLDNPDSFSKYFRWTNRVDKQSMIVICTNIVYKQKTTVLNNCMSILNGTKSSKHYRITDPTFLTYPGLTRRIGLTGNVTNTKQSVYNSPDEQITFSITSFDQVHLKRNYTQEEMSEFVYEKYRRFVSEGNGITVLMEQPPKETNFDISLTASSFEALKEAFKNGYNSAKTLTGFSKDVCIKADVVVGAKIHKAIYDIKTMFPTSVENVTESQLQEMAINYSSQLNRLCPGVSMFIHIRGSLTAVLLNKTLYLPETNHSTVQIYDLGKDGLRISSPRFNTTYTWRQLATFFKEGVSNDMEGIPLQETQELMAYLELNRNILPYLKLETTNNWVEKNYARLRESQGVADLIKNPLVQTLAGIIGIVSVGAVITKIALMHRKEVKETKFKANGGTSWSDPDVMDPKLKKLTDRFVQDMFKADKVALVRAEAKAMGLEQAFNQWEADWRSNMHAGDETYEQERFDFALGELISLGKIQQIVALANKAPLLVSDSMKRLMGTKSNMVLKKDAIPSPPRKSVDLIADKVRGSMVRVSTELGTNYGMAVAERLIITVSHGIKDFGEHVMVQDNGKYYNACVILLDRNRDLAALHVTTKQWEMKPDIIKHFIKHSDLHDVNQAFFFKAIENETTVLGAKVSYFPQSPGLHDDENPFYNPKTELFKYYLAQANTLTTVFLPGDCGMPLISIKNQEYDIIAIHNGYSYSGVGCFSTTTRELLANAFRVSREYNNKNLIKVETPAVVYENEFVSNAYNPDPQLFEYITPNGFKRDFQCYMPVMYLEALKERRMSRFQRSSPDLPVMGFFPNLNTPSNPTYKCEYTPILPEIDFPQTKVPSAITLKHVTDTSELIKDAKGNPSPLFTQCALFGKDTVVGTLDEEAWKCTQRFMRMKVANMFKAKIRRLNLTEAINGFESLQAMDMKTSTGLYIKKFHKIITKRPENNPDVLFRFDGNKYVINQQTQAGRTLLDMTISAKNFISEGIPLAVFAKDNPKVELLPKEKVAKGKVRLFSEFDLYFNLVLRIFFGHQVSQLFENHLENDYAMGMNPYLDATYYYRKLAAFDGVVVSTDYKSLDKCFPYILIEEFCECFLQHESPEVRKAMAVTLGNTYHVIEGSVVPTNKGNGSGTFVTTPLNCFGIDTVNTYTFVKEFRIKFGCNPGYSAYIENCLIIALGDDKMSKLSPLMPISLDTMVKSAREFGLLLTPAKAEYEGEISFCSRIFFWDKTQQVCFPALKQESIYTCLYYGDDTHKEDTIARINVAIFEASLWDKEFFTRIQTVCMEKARQRGVFNNCFWFTYEEYRTNFVNYVRSNSDSPTLQVETNLNYKSNNKIQPTELLLSEFHVKNENINMSNYVSALFEHCSKNNIPVKIRDTPLSRGGKQLWEVTFELIINNLKEPVCSTGIGNNKKEAKQDAARVLLTKLGADKKFDPNEEIQAWVVKSRETFCSNTSTHVTTDEDDEIHELMKAFASLGKVQNVSYDYSTEDGISYTVQLTVTDQPADLVYDIICPLLTKNHPPSSSGKSNTGPSNIPVEPMTVNSAASYQGIARLPDGNQTAQPVAMAPTMGPPGEAINATNELVMTKTLNPVGAPNMLPVGAIGFDIKDLVYTTFLDQDVEVEITNEAPSGTILFQIPYGVDTGYTNKYIKSYAAQHERYAGALQYRLTTIGNQLYSGSIGVAWYPRRITTATTDISEMQKYSWYAKGVQMPWTEDITLHDARQELFWRKVSEDSGNLDDRPHLVVFLFVSVKNPYDAPSTVRIRVASKLAGSTEPNPFQFSNPELPSIIGSQLGFSNDNSGVTALYDVYKHFRNYPVNIYTDGTLAATFQSSSQLSPYFTTQASDLGLGGITGGIPSGQELYYGNPNALYFGSRSALVSNWPMLADKVDSSIDASMVSVKFITTLNKRDFGRYIQKCPFMASRGANLDEDGFNEAKVLNNWGTVEGLTFYQLHWSDLVFQTGTQPVVGRPAARTYVIGSNKLVTDKGIVLAIFYLATVESRDPCILNQGSFVGSPPDFTNYRVELDYDRIETSSSSPSGLLTTLPLGWNKISLTTVLPSVVLTGDPTSFTTTDDVTVLHDFSQYDSLPDNMCSQFALIDTRSNQIVATVRYLQEYRIFVINKKFTSDSNYKVLPVDGTYLAIARLTVINRGLEFPVTDTGLWVDRTSTTSMRNAGMVESSKTPFDYEVVRVTRAPSETGKSNAWLAAASIGGGAMQGIGQGLNAMADRKFQMKMQGNQFQFLEGMQGRSFDFRELMQEAQFGQERDMAAIHMENQMAIDTNRARQSQIARGMEGRVLSMPGQSYA